MKKNFFPEILTILLFCFLMVNCNEGTTGQSEPALPPTFELTTEISDNTPVALTAEETYRIEFKAENATEITANSQEGWTVTVNKEEGYADVTAPASDSDYASLYKMTLTAQNGEETTSSKEISFYCVKSFDDPKGTFILNEGNMTTENGSLTYITPEGYVIDDVYKQVNGTELGNVCQDMYIQDGKIYIISQNGDENPVGTSFENDGMLVIADAKTLKKIDSYSKEDLKKLVWPSHIAVLDEEHIYIRDNGTNAEDNGNGKIWRLNTKDCSITEIQGTEGAPKAPLYVKNGKVYTYKYEKKYGLLNYFYLWEIDAASDAVTVYNSSTGNYIPVSILPTQKENAFWTVIQNEKDETAYKITQMSLREVNHTISISYPDNMLEDVPNSGASGRMLVSPSDDTFYYTSSTYVIKGTYAETGTGTSTGTKPVVTTEAVLDLSELDTDARMVYNGMGIHPETGHIYINTLKSYETWNTHNTIWEFDFTNGATEPVNKWNGYTNFPAGFFFPVTE